jgi:D-glycero-D-manno-heptose 1,7-bisphosphate phosphatase
METRGVFLDRDGIVNKELGDYIMSFEDFEVLPALIPFMQAGKKMNCVFIVITNQAGIAKGLYDKALVERCHSSLSNSLAVYHLEIKEYYYCPHHPDFGLCWCRKPGSLMIEKAMARFHLKPENCIMLGDKPRDVEAAEGAGIKGFLLEPNAPLKDYLACYPKSWNV